MHEFYCKNKSKHLTLSLELPVGTQKNSEDILSNISKGDIREDDLFALGELTLENGQQLYTVMRERILDIAGDPILSLVELREEDRNQDNLSMTMLVAAARFKDNVKVCIIICIILHTVFINCW